MQLPCPPLRISVVGPAGAGKSALGMAIAQALGEGRVGRVPTDYFFLPRPPGMTLRTFLTRPLDYDWGLIDRLLAYRPGSPASTPDVDLTSFIRRSDSGGLRFAIRPAMLFDAMRPHPRSDLLIRVDAPAALRRERIAMRDRQWGTNMLGRWPHLQATWLDACRCARLRWQSPDLLLDGRDALQDNVLEVVALLHERQLLR
ncbi:hypothetical protein ACX12D_36150 (plasmid) [Cupriavidus sp. PET2-C1]